MEACGLEPGMQKAEWISQAQAEATGPNDQIVVENEGETKGKSDSNVSNSNQMARDIISQ